MKRLAILNNSGLVAMGRFNSSPEFSDYNVTRNRGQMNKYYVTTSKGKRFEFVTLDHLFTFMYGVPINQWKWGRI